MLIKQDFFVLDAKPYVYNNNTMLCKIWGPECDIESAIVYVKGHLCLDKFTLYTLHSKVSKTSKLPKFYDWEVKHVFTIAEPYMLFYLSLNKILIALMPHYHREDLCTLFVEYVKCLRNNSLHGLLNFKLYLLRQQQIPYENILQPSDVVRQNHLADVVIDSKLIKFLN